MLDSKLAIRVAYQIIDMHKEIEALRDENRELREYRDKYRELLAASTKHSAGITAGWVKLLIDGRLKITDEGISIKRKEDTNPPTLSHD